MSVHHVFMQTVSCKFSPHVHLLLTTQPDTLEQMVNKTENLHVWYEQIWTFLKLLNKTFFIIMKSQKTNANSGVWRLNGTVSFNDLNGFHIIRTLHLINMYLEVKTLHMLCMFVCMLCQLCSSFRRIFLTFVCGLKFASLWCLPWDEQFLSAYLPRVILAYRMLVFGRFSLHWLYNITFVINYAYFTLLLMQFWATEEH